MNRKNPPAEWRWRHGESHLSGKPAWYHSGVKLKWALTFPIIIFIYAGLSGCSPAAEAALTDPWQYTDLRSLDPADADTPSHDIIAAYLRESNGDLQVRIDLLEAVSQLDYDLYLGFDLQPGGSLELPILGTASTFWDVFLKIPIQGSIELFDKNGRRQAGSQVLVMRDLGKATVLISLRKETISDLLLAYPISRKLRVQAFLTPAGGEIPSDQTSIFSLDGTPPEPVHVLMTFWNTYPAYTPVSALRRWDGAHTGPNGGRHGLFNLLRTAAANNIPLILLDLNNPISLSALDFAGKVVMIHELQANGTLVLPRSLPDPSFGPQILTSQILQEYSRWAEQISAQFMISDQGFFYSPGSSLAELPEEALIFLPVFPNWNYSVEDPSDGMTELPILRAFPWKRGTIIPFYQPSHDQTGYRSWRLQAEQTGLSSQWKRILVENAIRANQYHSPDNRAYINLGGELPDSTWGDPASARAAFRWISENPWVQVLGPHDLISMERDSAKKSDSITKPGLEAQQPELREAVDAALLSAPTNPLSQAAWQVLFSLFNQVYPFSVELPALRANYSRQVWSLLAAADWAESPKTLSTCAADPDQDGELECILASLNTYAQFEIPDGSLTYLFAFDPEDTKSGIIGRRVHQLVGPGSQLVSGLSDPDRWNLNGGLAADPETITGAFAGPFTNLLPRTGQDSITFFMPEGDWEKTFQLEENGMRVESEPLTKQRKANTLIPILLDPWERFSADWSARYESSSNDFEFLMSSSSGTIITLQSTNQLTISNFLQGRTSFTGEEDPNFDYPDGYFLPFSLIIAEIDSRDGYQIVLEIQDSRR